MKKFFCELIFYLVSHNIEKNKSSEHVMEGHEGHEGHGDHDMGGHEMHMNMYFTEDLGFYVLFQGWMVMDEGALAGSCIGMLIFAILLEGIKCKSSSLC